MGYCVHWFVDKLQTNKQTKQNQKTLTYCPIRIRSIIYYQAYVGKKEENSKNQSLTFKSQPGA